MGDTESMRRTRRPTPATHVEALFVPTPKPCTNVLPMPHGFDTDSSLAATRPLPILR